MRPPQTWRIRLFMPLIVLLLLSPCAAQTVQPELRGVWLTNVDSEMLSSRAAIAEAMQFLADHHFNAVLPVVWNDGVALYPSAIMIALATYYTVLSGLQGVV